MQNVIGGLVLAVIGILLLVNPRGVWTVSERWKHTGSFEASPAFVVIARMLGCILMVMGVLVAAGILK